jgi:arsenite-transporting ATPase
VFPPEVDDYFGAWRERQLRHLAEVTDAFAPVPVLVAPYFEREIQGPEMLERLGATIFHAHSPAAVLHQRLAHQLQVGESSATLRLDLPFVEKGEISLKKIGLELVVRVGPQKRTIMLPPALGDWRPANAAFADGALEVTFAAPVAAVNGRDAAHA